MDGDDIGNGGGIIYCDGGAPVVGEDMEVYLDGDDFGNGGGIIFCDGGASVVGEDTKV